MNPMRLRPCESKVVFHGREERQELGFEISPNFYEKSPLN